MKRFSILLIALLLAAGTSVYGAYENVGYLVGPQKQHQNWFTGTAKQVSKGTATATVWTVKAPYQVGKYILTEIFRPFVPIRDKLIDLFGVEVQE